MASVSGSRSIVVEKKFGRTPTRSSSSVCSGSAERRLASFQLLTKAEIRHEKSRFSVLAHIDQDILRFEITVNNPQAVQVAQSVRHLIEHPGHVTLASLCQIPVQVRLLNDIGQGRLTELKRDIEECSALLLGKVTDDCAALANRI
jgi:hypothetical protein